ncbi:MAG: trigger factor, partial [Clostridiales bacterium]|nr:trigger factor [Clostridiales bacterium]
MEYTVSRENNEVSLEITLDAGEWEAAVQHAYDHDKNKYALPGFRKGKVPRKILEKNYGAGVFYDEAFNIAFSQYYGEILEKEKIDPVDRPDVDVKSVDKDTGAVFSAKVTVRPEVKLGAYKGLKIPKASAKVTPDEIEREVNHALERASRKIPVEERAVQNGDFADIDYSGSVDGVKFDGGTAEHQELEIGSGSFIPGFEEQLVGVEIGGEKDVKVTFPGDYHAAELAGKEAVFAVKVHGISIKQLPELNDEFAKDVSEFDTLADYRADIAKNLAAQKEKAAK